MDGPAGPIKANRPRPLAFAAARRGR